MEPLYLSNSTIYKQVTPSELICPERKVQLRLLGKFISSKQIF